MLDSLLLYAKTFILSLMTKVVKQGPIPDHIAIIMDGNRRFARKHKDHSFGHSYGFVALERVDNI
jgi:ditrans,polycis-polyprenyl diphosphate synthase